VALGVKVFRRNATAGGGYPGLNPMLMADPVLEKVKRARAALDNR
jgi:hypothetical protein